MNTSAKANGLSLVEVMIVLAIIAVLAAVAYPSYREQVRKARRAEGRALLLDTAQALEKCKTLYGAYNSAGCALLATLNGGGIPSENDFYRVNAPNPPNPNPDVSAFTLQAVPSLADSDCGTLLLKQDGDRCIDAGGGEQCLSTGSPSAQECW